jgi:hypothetical protein
LAFGYEKNAKLLQLLYCKLDTPVDNKRPCIGVTTPFAVDEYVGDSSAALSDNSMLVFLSKRSNLVYAPACSIFYTTTGNSFTALALNLTDFPQVPLATFETRGHVFVLGRCDSRSWWSAKENITLCVVHGELAGLNSKGLGSLVKIVLPVDNDFYIYMIVPGGESRRRYTVVD